MDASQYEIYLLDNGVPPIFMFINHKLDAHKIIKKTSNMDSRKYNIIICICSAYI